MGSQGFNSIGVVCVWGVPNGECGREISGVTEAEAEHSITSRS